MYYGNLIKKSNNLIFSIMYRSSSNNKVFVNKGNSETGTFYNEIIELEKSDDFTLYFKGIDISNYEYISTSSNSRSLLAIHVYGDIDIMAVKLEFGNVSTLGRYLDDNLIVLSTYNPVTELYTAMQYYEIIYTKQEKYYVQFKVPKIKVPSITFYDYNGNVIIGNATNISRFGFQLSTVTCYKVTVDAR